MRTLPPIERFVARVEDADALDPVIQRAQPVAARLGAGRRGPILRGQWLGHAVHPLLTDFPLGCWIGAGLLDLTAPRAGRDAARRLVGLGLLTVPATALTGIADWSTIDTERVRRVGVTHAAGNTVVALAYLLSWRARRRGHHGRGVAWALVGGGLAWITGYLGGHLSFGRAVGVGERGLVELEPAAGAPVPKAS